MMTMVRNVLVAALGLLIIVSCKKDDDGTTEVEIRDRGEVQSESSVNLTTYLETHFYNYEEFADKPVDFDYKIVFDTISGDNADKIPLIEQVVTRNYTFQDTEYKLYVLEAQEGAGIKPTFADSTLVNYQGNVLGGNKFDSSVTPVWFDLTQVVFGFANGVSELRAGTEFSQNEDGTYNFGRDYGIGAVFIPSGLAYFNSSGTGFGAYSDLVFTFDLYRAIEDTDNDNDGVPNWKEDINGNNYVNELLDDTDGDRVPDYLDTDDDGDGTPTRDELDFDEDGNTIYIDSDNDGVFDYLDPDIS
ncbi:hypothetical protein DSM03_10360 [Leeuwenhoekiella aestuarii]|uniref:peptidylprolyl isomerase n=2 Tax=Leeuwenhoekiella aestuarii TaxID=2249426 RepID=A0A4Q0NY41_9FLAO|nr:hypothetical protein [Leeuwenhoekiella aestuarii]RXG15875.1 hypothetical protein DSM03_10360 [Leeuwenhoekiella aestuarii]RXG16569.1 hypothetical protein DSM04_102150 [Leeuwenhoekiella aestuarii]